MKKQNEPRKKTLPTVLVVEDDLAMRDLIMLVFEQQSDINLNLITAENGIKALEMTQKYHPRVMILDILLPQMNGLQLLQQLKEEQLLEKIQVIVISALGYKEVVAQAIQAGAKDFLVKPFNLDALVDRTRQALIA